VTKFLDKSFSSRPASQEYRDNYDRAFAKAMMSEFDERIPAPGARRKKKATNKRKRKTLMGKRT